MFQNTLYCVEYNLHYHRRQHRVQVHALMHDVGIWLCCGQQLKRIRRAEKKGNETVTEEKFSVLFQCEFNVGGGDMAFQVWVSAGGDMAFQVWVSVGGDMALLVGWEGLVCAASESG